LDSLFFVHGNLEANAAKTWYGNYNPFDEFIMQSVDDLIEGSYAWVGDYSTRTTGGGMNPGMAFDRNVVFSGAEHAKQTGTIEINWSESVSTFQLFSSPKTNSGTATYSLVDELLKLYDEVKNTVVEFFEELDWWKE